MARSNHANANRHGRYPWDDDDHDNWHHRRDDCDSHDNHNSSGKHGSPVRRGDDRYEYDIDLDKKRDGVDFELDMERDGKWLEIDIEIGKLDFDLKLDARKLQADTSPVVSVVGGDGTAVGNDTLVTADIFSRLIDFGAVTIAFGTVKFSSTAVSGEGQDPAFAAATTFADVSGADLVFVFNKTTSIFSDCDIPYAGKRPRRLTLQSTSKSLISRKGRSPITSMERRHTSMGAGSAVDRAPNIDGNVSMLEVDAQALGANTLVDVFASILTIEGQLSSVSAMAVSAVG